MAEPGAARWAVRLALGLGALWLARLGVVLASVAGLHVDEAQYWDWAQSLQWGYYSKPPGIAALLAASTALAGDGPLGVRWLAMACWPAAALVLGRLAGAIGGPPAAARAAWLMASTAAAGLLGLVATTDAPLLLCWSLLMAASWRAWTGGGWPAWLAAGLALGAGLLSKYTMGAALLSWAWLLLRPPPALAAVRATGPAAVQAAGATRPSVAGGMALATVLAAACLLPHLAWNAAAGWPTWRHTAEITTGAVRPAGLGWADALGDYLGGQLLLVGPAAWPLLAVLVWRAWRDRRGGSHTGILPAARNASVDPVVPVAQGADPRLVAAGRAFGLVFALPLPLLGLAQALNARTQMNWTAPALLGLCLCCALAAPRRPLPAAAWRATVLAGLLLPAGLALAGAVAQRWAGGAAAPDAAPPRWDVWARMRGWEPALAALRPALAAQPGLPVVATQRELIVQARHAWRDLARPVLALPPAGAPQHHYELAHALPRAALAAPWLLLDQDRPDAAPCPSGGRCVLLSAARSGRVGLRLWRVEPATALAAKSREAGP